MTRATRACSMTLCGQTPVVIVRWEDPHHGTPVLKFDLYCAPHGERFANSTAGRQIFPITGSA